MGNVQNRICTLCCHTVEFSCSGNFSLDFFTEPRMPAKLSDVASLQGAGNHFMFCAWWQNLAFAACTLYLLLIRIWKMTFVCRLIRASSMSKGWPFCLSTYDNSSFTSRKICKQQGKHVKDLSFRQGIDKSASFLDQYPAFRSLGSKADQLHCFYGKFLLPVIVFSQRTVENFCEWWNAEFLSNPEICLFYHQNTSQENQWYRHRSPHSRFQG